MFANDMIESHSNKCSIDDIESEVFGELLTFIYTGKSPKAQSMAHKLLAAAEKYEILELEDLDNSKNICEDLVFIDLTVDNAIQSLKIADKYNANKILDKIVEFIVINLPFVRKVSGIEWQTFIAENPKINFKIFKAIAKKVPMV
jgi:speckle-type POZ protein